MSSEDHYLTIASPSEGIYKEKGSKFLSFAFPIECPDDVKNYLQALKKTYFDARHHCYAYHIGHPLQHFREQDDGEPSSTAGKPIRGQLQSLNLTNIVVFVVRYFGGTKLGVSGLIQAYKAAARSALEAATIVEKVVLECVEIRFSYETTNAVMRVIKEHHLEADAPTYDEGCRMILRCRRGQYPSICEILQKAGAELIQK